MFEYFSVVGAINAILQYSPDELSILKRKIVTREILFQYLHDNKINVSLPINKHEIIEKILDYWGIPYRSNGSNITPSTSSLLSKSSTTRIESEKSDETIQKTTNSNQDNIYQLALQFTEWFYSLLNANEPISTEHFYADAKLKLILLSNEQHDVKVVENNTKDIVETLYQTKIQHNLFFNPNISTEGVQGRMDPHGLVMVIACGTLHVNNVCVGVFEQLFALARDPFCENNWKIKNTQLNLQSKAVLAPPKLCDSDLGTDSLTLQYCTETN